MPRPTRHGAADLLALSAGDELGRVPSSTCPRLPGGWRFAALVTASETFPDLCSRRSGMVSLPVIGAAERRLPGGRGHVELRTRLNTWALMTSICSEWIGGILSDVTDL